MVGFFNSERRMNGFIPHIVLRKKNNDTQHFMYVLSLQKFSCLPSHLICAGT